jgi:GTPase SAR1 family protein
VIDEVPCALELLDTGAMSEFAQLSDQWIRDSDGILLTYSSSDLSSFTKINSFYKRITQIKAMAKEQLKLPTSANSATRTATRAIHRDFNPAVVLVATKCDQVTERAVSANQGATLARKLGIQFLETSSKDHVKVRQAFFGLIRQLRRGTSLQADSANIHAYQPRKSYNLTNIEEQASEQHEQPSMTILNFSRPLTQRANSMSDIGVAQMERDPVRRSRTHSTSSVPVGGSELTESLPMSPTKISTSPYLKVKVHLGVFSSFILIVFTPISYVSLKDQVDGKLRRIAKPGMDEGGNRLKYLAHDEFMDINSDEDLSLAFETWEVQQKVSLYHRNARQLEEMELYVK